jgi:CBS domain-containing protein
MARSFVIGAVMTTHPVSVGCATSIAEASELMRRRAVRHLVVLDRDEVVGVLSQRDLAAFSARKHVSEEVACVGEAMSPEPYVVPPSAPLADVAREMARRAIGSTVVVDGTRPVGVFTTTDALHTLAALLE